MKNAVDILEDLLPELKSYIAETEDPTLDGFRVYLAQQTEKKPVEHGEESASKLMGGYEDDRALLAFHINRLGKYAKYYIKDALKGSPLATGDDFGFLAAVIEKGEMSKSALISYNVHEVPSGMDVIKRLLSRGLITERVDPDDRRMKLLSPTDIGKHAFFEVTRRMQQVAAIVKGDLSEQELSQLNHLLGRLDQFHEVIYKDQKDYELDTIVRTYLNDANKP